MPPVRAIALLKKELIQMESEYARINVLGFEFSEHYSYLLEFGPGLIKELKRSIEVLENSDCFDPDDWHSPC